MSARVVKQHLPSKNPKITLCGFDINPDIIPPEDAPRCQRCASKTDGSWTEGMARPLPNLAAQQHRWYPTNSRGATQ